MHDTSTEDNLAEVPVPSLGKKLRERREAMGLSLEAVAERTRIRSVFLQAFETDDYEALPATAYAVGFLRQYTGLLGLDAEQVVADFRCAIQSTGKVMPQHAKEEPSRTPVEAVDKQSPRLWVWLLMVVGAILVAGLLVYGKTRETGSPVAEESASIAEAIAEPAEEFPAQELPPNSDATAGQEIAGQDTAGQEIAGQDTAGQDTAVSSISEVSAPAQNLSAPSETSGMFGNPVVFPLPAAGAVFRIESKGHGWVEIEDDRRPLQNYDMQPGTRVEWTVNEFAEIRVSISGGMQAWLAGREVSLPDTCIVILGQPPATATQTAMSAHTSEKH